MGGLDDDSVEVLTITVEGADTWFEVVVEK